MTIKILFAIIGLTGVINFNSNKNKEAMFYYHIYKFKAGKIEYYNLVSELKKDSSLFFTMADSIVNELKKFNVDDFINANSQLVEQLTIGKRFFYEFKEHLIASYSFNGQIAEFHDEPFISNLAFDLYCKKYLVGIPQWFNQNIFAVSEEQIATRLELSKIRDKLFDNKLIKSMEPFVNDKRTQLFWHKHIPKETKLFLVDYFGKLESNDIVISYLKNIFNDADAEYYIQYNWL